MTKFFPHISGAAEVPRFFRRDGIRHDDKTWALSRIRDRRGVRELSLPIMGRHETVRHPRKSPLHEVFLRATTRPGPHGRKTSVPGATSPCSMSCTPLCARFKKKNKHCTHFCAIVNHAVWESSSPLPSAEKHNFRICTSTHRITCRYQLFIITRSAKTFIFAILHDCT